jgi:cytochrome c
MVRFSTIARRFIAGGLLVLGLLSALPVQAGDAAKGKSVFTSECAMCHSNARNGPTILGPTLFGVVGRKAGTVAGFAYSSGMKSAGFAWSDAQLAAYLPSPRALVAGTKMPYGGLKNPTKLADLIAYLDTLK